MPIKNPELIAVAIASGTGLCAIVAAVLTARRDNRVHVEKYNLNALVAGPVAAQMLKDYYPDKDITVAYFYRKGFVVLIDGSPASGAYWDYSEAIEEAHTKARLYGSPNATEAEAEEAMQEAV